MPDLKLRDVPASKRDEDQLGLADYADVMYDFIRTCQTPLTIGIQGDWGIGKTSLLNMIKEKLKSRIGGSTRYPCVDFNTWQYSMFGQEEYLPVACMKALIGQVEKLAPSNGMRGSVTDKAKRAGRTVAQIASTMSVGFMGASVSMEGAKEAWEGDESPQFQDLSEAVVRLKQEFADLIQAAIAAQDEKVDRIVIFIDDLDRVKPVRALELLEVLKNFLDVPGCVFLLAVDYEVVRMGMRQKLGPDMQESSGKSFFDKIINVPFNMPTSSYDLGNYIIRLLKTSGFARQDMSVTQDTKAFYEQVTSVTVGRNPRNIKRVVNYAKLLDKIREKSVDKSDQSSKKNNKEVRILYALMCMQIAYPELFEYFADNPTADTVQNLENWEFLEGLPEGKKVLSRARDEAQMKSNIGAFVDELFKLLDEDNNGEITHHEMEPVLRVMQYAKLTQATTAKTPLEQLRTIVRENGGARHADFLSDVVESSMWNTRPEIELKQSGSRYWTIVMDRRQVGSYVSLKSQNRSLIMRLKPSVESIRRHIQMLKSQNATPVDANFEEFLCPIGEVYPESTTGYGDTVVRLDRIIQLRQKRRKIKVVNLIYEAVHRIEVEKASVMSASVAPSTESGAPVMSTTSN
jgi:hypothetical protein